MRAHGHSLISNPLEGATMFFPIMIDFTILFTKAKEIVTNR